MTVEVSKEGGSTALGVSALPGETFTVALDTDLDGVAIKLNTHRTGSTREFNADQYDRPKFLQSPAFALSGGVTRTLTSPYGGMLQLVTGPSSAPQQVTLTLTRVARHPVLEDLSELSSYLEQLVQTPFSHTEIKTPYIQIHSRVDMMLEAFEAPLYAGDPELFFDHLSRFMIDDTYNLAGFAGPGLALGQGVLAFCQRRGWDCTDPVVHGSPAVQHINIDKYAHCGGGCAGNPYDQAWALIPLGWGETHEIGHNLQRGRLMVHGNRSGEVSNQIFPIHKHVTYGQESGESLSPERSAYRTTFDVLQASVAQDDPWSHVFDAIWAGEGIYDNNNERIAFYMQVVHLNDDVEPLETGWDVYTLMYLHERLFTQALERPGDWQAQREALGFDLYAAPPSQISGNDFMVISMSLITQKDQRPFFEMWGIDFSRQASDQVASYDLSPVPSVFFASEDCNAEPHPDPVPIDGLAPWPL